MGLPAYHDAMGSLRIDREPSAHWRTLEIVGSRVDCDADEPGRAGS
ncbi:MAG: hypothetical protein QOD65_457 [Gaiellales bacterium]|nr:hypothetical protein [Gaiellales bacterium]